MDEKSIILVGGPDSGKSNYLARLWLAIQCRRHSLTSMATPDDIKYIEAIAEHILQGKFVPRTEPEDKKRDFQVSIKSTDGKVSANIVVPDMYGEIWRKAVKNLEIPQKWLDTLRRASSAILFVRVHSENNIQPLDWVTSQGLLKMGLGNAENNNEIPTQVSLIELLRFIDENISRDGKRLPKVAVIVCAWDLLHKEEALEGADVYLRRQFPMFAGRLSDIKSLDIATFGCSIVGGDFNDADFVNAFLERKNADDSGYIITSESNKTIKEIKDVTVPIKWLLDKHL